MLLDETRRLERKLSQTQQERDDLKMELEASSRRQLELSAQLDRARLMARTVKQELDKRRGMEKQNSVSSASST